MKRGTILAAALAWMAAAAPAGASPPIWTVRGAHGKVVIFGSVHLLPSGLKWRSPALDAALAEATDVWFEIPINQSNDEAVRTLTTRKGLMPPNDDLWRHLTNDQRKRLEQAAASVGIPPSALSPMRPWLAELTLALASDTRSGAQANAGVEAAIQNDAPPTARRHAFETVDQQIGFLSGGTSEQQVASLDETVKEMTADPDLYQRTVREWAEGDLAALKKDDLDTMKAATPADYERLITRRNRRWADVLVRLVGGRGTTLVVVGAGHLIGPEGVPALLRARGLRVEGP
jgi:uncharacterized protein YbaP (TraB family)